MRKVQVIEQDGTRKDAYLLDAGEEAKNTKMINFREHVYLGFLILGTLSFALGIYITMKRINGTK